MADFGDDETSGEQREPHRNGGIARLLMLELPTPGSSSGRRMAKNPRGQGRGLWLEGNRLFSEARYPDAIWTYTEAIQKDPLEADYYHNRAIARAALSDADGAMEDVWRAIELAPDSRETRRLASLLHLTRGEEAKARRYDPNATEFRVQHRGHRSDRGVLRDTTSSSRSVEPGAGTLDDSSTPLIDLVKSALKTE